MKKTTTDVITDSAEKNGKNQLSPKLKNRKIYIFFVLCVDTVILMTVVLVALTSAVFVKLRIRNQEDLTLGFFILLGLISGFVIGTVITVLFSRFFMKPFDSLMRGMKSLAHGDFSTRINLGKYDIMMQASENFNNLARELENTQMLRSDFVNSFSHEFKTPIASINALIDLLKKQKLPPEKQAEYLSVIEAETNRLLDMSANVLSLTKVEAQSVLGNLESYNISEQIRHCILLLEKKWTRKGLSLSLDFDEYTVRANSDLMMQVWMNIIDNAIKFSEENGEIRIDIKKLQSGKLCIAVENTGIAISDEDKKKIFTKFYQADTSHTKEGNGIGLSIVKHIVSLHSGSVDVSSADGRTVFTVTLPQL